MDKKNINTDYTNLQLGVIWWLIAWLIILCWTWIAGIIEEYWFWKLSRYIEIFIPLWFLIYFAINYSKDCKK